MGIVARRTIVATVVVCALGLAGITSASADTHLYRDALRPNGHERTTAQKFADFRACGYRKGTYVTDSEAARIDACMRSRGWTLDRVVESRPGKRARHAHARHNPGAAPAREWRKFDEDNGVWVTCHAILGGIGEECSNF
jgi:hypothetical protein